MLHQRRADGDRSALDQREDARIDALRRDRGLDRLGDQFAHARMRFMPLHDHRAAGGERGGRIAAGDGEGQREVRRAEHAHGAERALDQHQLRPGHGRAIGQRFVMPAIEIAAVADMRGEQLQLTSRAAPLAHEPRFGQAGFRYAHRRDRVVAGVDLSRDRLEEGRAGFGVAAPEGLEGAFGGLGGGVDVGRKPFDEGLRFAGDGRGGEGLARPDPGAVDEVVSVQRCAHGEISSFFTWLNQVARGEVPHQRRRAESPFRAFGRQTHSVAQRAEPLV